MTNECLKDVTNAKEIKLTRQVIRYNSPYRGEAQITALQQIFQESTQRFGYFPHRLLSVTVHDLEGKVHKTQPAILCDGPKDEAVIWQKPREEKNAHPDLGLYVFKLIK